MRATKLKVHHPTHNPAIHVLIFGDLTPITLANEHGLHGDMTILDLMAARAEWKIIFFKVSKIPDVPYKDPAKKSLDDLVEKEIQTAEDTGAMFDDLNSQLKEDEKNEDKLVKDILKL